MTTLVTGGAGFVGVPLVHRLVAAGHDVAVLDDLSRGRGSDLPPGVEVVAADIRDTEVLRATFDRLQPSAVVHLAALHFIPDCERDPPATMAINATATAELGRIAGDGGVGRFVFTSTAAVYQPSHSPHAETDEIEPVDVYGRSKAAAEQRLRAVFGDERLSILRLFNVYGPGETNPHLIPEIVEQAVMTGRLRLGLMDTVRDYVHVDDVAVLLQHAVAGKLSGTVNVGTGRGHTARDVVDAVAAVLGRELPVEVDPARLRPVDRPHLVADVSVLRAAAPWEPVDLATGLEGLVAAARAYTHHT
jgi:UDP-glucose 4-epimerase